LGSLWRIGLALVALVAAALLASGCGGGREAGTTDLKSLYAEQIKVPAHAELAAGVDPDDTAASSPQFNTSIAFLGGGHFRLTVTNGSDLGFLNSFTWVHPPQMTITAVKSSSSGTCRLLSGDIVCTGMAIKPPKCSCLPGGLASVRFDGHIKTAPGQSYGGVQHGWLRIGNVTPVPYTIPSYLGAAPVDLPLCAKGTESTEDHPCVHSGG
jgi:hypothetical protein